MRFFNKDTRRAFEVRAIKIAAGISIDVTGILLDSFNAFRRRDEKGFYIIENYESNRIGEIIGGWRSEAPERHAVELIEVERR